VKICKLTISARADFLAGQYFDIRLEVHAPKNGSEAIGKPLDEKFTFTIAKGSGKGVSAAEYFKVQEPKLEKWNFTWFEGMSMRTLKRSGRIDRNRSIRS
jgi:hypothetical protein